MTPTTNPLSLVDVPRPVKSSRHLLLVSEGLLVAKLLSNTLLLQSCLSTMTCLRMESLKIKKQTRIFLSTPLVSCRDDLVKHPESDPETKI